MVLHADVWRILMVDLTDSFEVQPTKTSCFWNIIYTYPYLFIYIIYISIYVLYILDYIYRLYYIISYYIISYHIILYLYISYHIILYHIISYYIISYHLISYYITSYYIISYHIILYHIISYYIILYYVILYYIILYYICTNSTRLYHPQRFMTFSGLWRQFDAPEGGERHISSMPWSRQLELSLVICFKKNMGLLWTIEHLLESRLFLFRVNRKWWCWLNYCSSLAMENHHLE